ncbi:hypothetical protein BCR44DRAFT_1514117 [Catenaria anguillulae PL171]|uniref:Tyrosinase copper-binding domain-containing protein n=1 Tax=Catenaria anguillulae PL171 TaxID=765915 RepID=A0A1Y2HIE7_9FUNG|nr:hypothetical protein BCR44DRAFT_1514117 [Catenaria anguillulae PL171]
MRSPVPILAVMLLAYAALASAACQQVRIRRPYSSLSQKERADYAKAINTMKQSGALDRMTLKHRTGIKYHMTTQFLPMHRAILKEFEDELIKANPAIQGLPYWDELADSAAPLSSTMFATDGVSAMQPGALTAPFAGLTDDSGRVVQRRPRSTISGKFNWIPSSVSMAAALKSFKTFGEMSGVVEVVPYNAYHGMIGGHMGDPRISPADPVFYLHHCYIDLLWALEVKVGDGTVLYENKWKNADMIKYEDQLCYRYESALVPPPLSSSNAGNSANGSGNGGKAKKLGFFSKLWKGIKGVFGGGKSSGGHKQQDVIVSTNESTNSFPTNATTFVHGVDPLPELVIRQLMPTMDLDMAIKKVRAAERKVNEIAAQLAAQVEKDLASAKNEKEAEKVADAVPTVQDLVAGNTRKADDEGKVNGPKKAIKEQAQDEQPAVTHKVEENGAERAAFGLATVVATIISSLFM